MRKINAIVLVLLLIGCAPAKTKHGEDGKRANFSKYKGKTVSYVTYCDGCGPAGDLVIIRFTDGTQMAIYAYKYDMKIY